MEKRIFYIIDERSVGSRDEFSIALPRKWAREKNIHPKGTVTFCAGEIGLVIPSAMHLSGKQLFRLLSVVEMELAEWRRQADIWLDVLETEDIKIVYPHIWKWLEQKLREDGYL